MMESEDKTDAHSAWSWTLQVKGPQGRFRLPAQPPSPGSHPPWVCSELMCGLEMPAGKFCCWCVSLYSSGRLCTSWTMCMMCFRLCLNDVFLQPQSATFRWFVPYFCIFKGNSWLIDWIFNFSQKCLTLAGRLCLLSPWRREKDLYKVSFSINILYDEWLWAETPWWAEAILPHTSTKGSSRGIPVPTPLWSLPPNPSDFSCHQTLPSHFGIGFQIYLRSFAAIILNKLSWIFCQLRCKKTVHYWPPCFTCNRRPIFTH